MPAPLEFRDPTPLTAVVLDVREQVEREKVYRDALAWKIRLLEREIQYLDEQVTSLIDTLKVPEEIVNLGQESETLDTILLQERERLSGLIGIVSDEGWKREGESLLKELDRELASSTHPKREESIHRILQAYVTLGGRYKQKFQHSIHSLRTRTKLLEGELRRSVHEENRQRKLLHLSTEYLSGHPESTYGEFREHILALLGREMALEIQQVLEHLLDEGEGDQERRP
jgi:hypothetical protein